MKNLTLTGCPVPSESEVQADLVSRLRATGWLVVRVNSGLFTDKSGRPIPFYRVIGAPDESAGFPDLIAMKGACQSRGDGIQRGPVRVRLFEVKRHGGNAGPEQERFADFALLYGVAVETIYGFEALEALDLN